MLSYISNTDFNRSTIYITGIRPYINFIIPNLFNVFVQVKIPRYAIIIIYMNAPKVIKLHEWFKYYLRLKQQLGILKFFLVVITNDS